MVWCKARKHRLVTGGLLGLGLVSLAGLLAGGYISAAASDEPKPVAGNARLRELMTQRYEILQRAVKDAQHLVETGRLDVPTFENLTVALYRAQADLCTTTAERVKVYEKLVDFLAAQEGLLEQQIQAGRATRMQLDQGKVVTLNARIDLERLRLGQSAAQPQSGQ